MLNHKELNLKKKEYEALIEVERGLRAGEFKHTTDFVPTDYEKAKIDKDKISAKSFNMGACGEIDSRDCGTVACIGGWVSFLSQGKTFDSVKAETYVCYEVDYKSELYRLYYPDTITWAAVTPLMAANAIRGYLNTGKVDWNEAQKVGEEI